MIIFTQSGVARDHDRCCLFFCHDAKPRRFCSGAELSGRSWHHSQQLSIPHSLELSCRSLRLCCSALTPPQLTTYFTTQRRDRCRMDFSTFTIKSLLYLKSNFPNRFVLVHFAEAERLN